jgi:diguanylate cyclase (GGDEF)-like protein
MSETVLIIEDELSLRESLICLLQREGFQAVAAANGVEGLEYAKRFQPHLILCDVSMPQLDGYGVLKALRQDPQIATIPFIFLTGKGEHQDLRQGMNLGADDYLLKPLTKQELLSAIQSRLQRHRLMLVAPPPLPPLPVPKPQAIEDTHDLLTHLPNRRYLQQILPRLLAQAQQYDHWVVVFDVNICRFSRLNAAFGYQMGDQLLQQLAERLAKLVKSQGLVARSNGDEFIVVLDGIVWEKEALDWAEQIAQCCAEPCWINEREIIVKVAIGGACRQPQQAIEADSLMLQAEMARRACQQAEPALPYLFHDVSMAEAALEQGLLETDLNRAIAQGEFQVYYQPQVTLPQGQITGMEALLRWRHPYRGMISPDRFIAIAEQMGLIVPIGEWVLRRACQQARRWQTQTRMPLKISVNLSIHQLQQENLAEQVTRVLQATDLHPCQLTLELTETNLMADMDNAIQTLSSLRNLGIQIAIDDFGKGYSSLHYLNNLPIDILKIDQSFVQQIPQDEHAVTIANAIITMAHDLYLSTVAEGVETPEQVEFLQAHGCHIMQGHLYSPALPQCEFEQLLRRQNTNAL